MYLIYFLVTLIWVIILDLTDFWESVSKGISYIITKGKVVKPFNLKPLSCSLCMSHHTNFLIMLLTGHFSIVAWFFILLMSYLTPIFADGMRLVRDFVVKLLDEIRMYFGLY